MNFRLFLAVEWGRAVGVKLECVRLGGGGGGGGGGCSQRGLALAGWVAASASPCTLILEVKGRPPPATVRSGELGTVYPTIIFSFWKFSKALLAPATSL